MEMHHRMMKQEEEAAWKRQKSRTSRVVELKEMSRRLAKDPSDPLQILLLASFLRDDVPWFYELALELYRAIRSSNRAEIADSRKRILEALMMLSSTPIAEEMKRDWKMLAILFENASPRLTALNLGSGRAQEPKWTPYSRGCKKDLSPG